MQIDDISTPDSIDRNITIPAVIWGQIGEVSKQTGLSHQQIIMGGIALVLRDYPLKDLS